MAYSTQSVVSDGTLAVLDISINYLDRDEISVYYNSLPNTTNWSWVGVSEKRIAFSPNVPNGTEVMVKRSTDLSGIRHNFSEGAAFTFLTLDEDLTQVLHIAQEASEANFAGDFYNDIDLHLNQITNLAAGVDPLDAVNVQQLGPYVADAQAAAVSAAQSAVDAGNNARLAIGTVTTGAPGSAAAASITGSPGAQTLAMTIPRGDVGAGVASGGTAGQLLVKNSGTNYDTVWQTMLYVAQDSATGAARMPSGTTAQRPAAPAYGDTRVNSTLNSQEWYNGSAWIAVGAGATGGAGNNVFFENDQAVTVDYTITVGKNAMSAGPITINTGITVTIPTGSNWVIN